MGGGGGTCSTAADCKQPGDPHCGQATCTGGLCGLELKPFSKLASQRAGDCKEKWCDGQGNVVEFTESSDFFDDGAECIANTCEAGKPVSVLVPNGDTCPKTGVGACFEGECVPCVQGTTEECIGNPVCDYTKCVPWHCVNGQWDKGSGETSWNCGGGACNGCSIGESCNVGSDCYFGVCAQGTCKEPTCSDGVRNNKETGVDCGSPNCPRCPAGQGCKLPSDCLSDVCWGGQCQAPSCTDGTHNGDETGEDCGGPCEPCPG